MFKRSSRSSRSIAALVQEDKERIPMKGKKSNVIDLGEKAKSKDRAPARIRVRIIQAHEITKVDKDLNIAGFIRLESGDEIEILEEDFCRNLHEKIEIAQ
jgi:hypothetical protein